MNKQLVIASNDRNPIKESFIQTLHMAALNCQLGYMDGMDPDTGDIIPLLCGVEYGEEGKPVKLWPLAIAFLDGTKLKNYLVPDGNGNYFNQNRDEIECDVNGEPIEGPDETGLRASLEAAESGKDEAVPSKITRKRSRKTETVETSES